MTATSDENGCLRIRLLPWQVTLLVSLTIVLITSISTLWLRVEQALPAEMARREFVTREQYQHDAQQTCDRLDRIQASIDEMNRYLREHH